MMRIVLAEIWYRRWASLFTTLVVAAVVATVVFFVLSSELAARRTQIIQRDIGLNLRIIPAETNLESYWVKGYSEGAIDQALLQRVADQQVANRLVPMLQRTVPWGAGEALLTGVGEELFSAGQAMKPVFGSIQKDEAGVTVGAIAAAGRGLSEGDSIRLLGKEFSIHRILAATGSVDDIRVYATLGTVQELLGMPQQLNEIRALECHCDADVVDPEAYIRSILEPLLPGTTVIRQDRIAEARRQQRLMMERLGVVATPIMIGLATVVLLGLAVQNVNQRQAEIGLLSSVGRTPTQIAGLIWLRSAVLGLIGGLLGAWLGMQIVSAWSSSWAGSGPVVFDWSPTRMLLGAAVGSLLASCGALVPAVMAARMDPARTLRSG
jgi:putative ABC transport system permease protein